MNTTPLKCFALFAFSAALAACGTSSTSVLPVGAQAGTSVDRTASEVIASPEPSVSGAPGDSMRSLPGDSMRSLPGNYGNVCPTPSAFGQASCPLEQNLGIVPISNAQASPITIKGYQPRDIEAMYHLPIRSGAPIVIVDAYDNPLVEQDLAVYRATFGLPACTSANGCFHKLNQAGAAGPYPARNVAWGTEIALDVEIASAACPNCKIVLMEANSASIDDLGKTVDRAAAMGFHVVSNSYSAREWSGEVNEEVHYNHPGVAITVASGDAGYGATYPASSKYVTSVGGSVVTGTYPSYTESAGWTYSGRACSKYITRPAWQSAYYCTTRQTNDVGAIADPGSGVAVYDTFVNSGQVGGWAVYGGTSVAAPIVAAAYALANDMGAINGPSRLYQRTAYLHKIGPYSYQFSTGLGSPNGMLAF